MLRKQRFRTVRLLVRSSTAQSGLLEFGSLKLRCAIGRSGISASKREGDGATPAGLWRLEDVFWRSDRALGRRPRCALPMRTIRRDAGWCDAPLDRNYNRPVRLPSVAGHERLWREDRLYDIIVVLDHNRRQRVKGRGSAIFVHVARSDHAPTEGCIALRERDLRLLLACVGRHVRIAICRRT